MAGIDQYTKILIRGGGADGSGTFTDKSVNARTISRTGSYITHSTTQTKFQSSSIKLSPYNSYAYAASNDDLELGSGNFVVDFWIYPVSLTYALNILHKGVSLETGWEVLVHSGGMVFRTGDDFVSSTNALTLNTWTHVAIVRSGNTLYLWKGGAAWGSKAYSATPPTNSGTFKLGYLGTDSTTTACYVDEVRFSKGTDRGWSSTFTPPTAAYSLELEHIPAGGAVAGGTAPYSTSPLDHTPSGGAVGGGASAPAVEKVFDVGGGAVGGGAADVVYNYASMLGYVPELRGDIEAFVTPVAVVDGYVPLLYADINDSGARVEGVVPSLYCEVETQHIINAAILGNIPSLYADVIASNHIASVTGYVPLLYARIDTEGQIASDTTLSFEARQVTAQQEGYSENIPLLYADIVADSGDETVLAFSRWA
jgi:hypothetical protein